LSTPDAQSAHGTRLNRRTTSSGSSTSPSGLIRVAVPSKSGLAARSRRSSSARGLVRRQPRQITRSRLPCSSTASAVPAAWCSPSTFCVITPATNPPSRRAVTARWPSFGSARAIVRQPRWLRAQ
jgi:hypothetical protein